MASLQLSRKRWTISVAKRKEASQHRNQCRHSPNGRPCKKRIRKNDLYQRPHTTPVKKPGLFTAACEKVRLTPRQMFAPSPKQGSTTTSVSSDRAEALAAIDSSLNKADQVTQLSLSSGVTVPIEAERVLKPVAMACATKYFDDDEKEGLALLTAMLQKFSISTRAKKPKLGI